MSYACIIHSPERETWFKNWWYIASNPLPFAYHYGRNIRGLEAGDGSLQGTEESDVDALTHELVEVDAATEQLNVALLEQGLVSGEERGEGGGG